MCQQNRIPAHVYMCKHCCAVKHCIGSEAVQPKMYNGIEFPMFAIIIIQFCVVRDILLLSMQSYNTIQDSKIIISSREDRYLVSKLTNINQHIQLLEHVTYNTGLHVEIHFIYYRACTCSYIAIHKTSQAGYCS